MTMQIKEFSLKVKEMLEGMISDEYELFNHSVIKANDTIHIAISVKKKGENIAKNIYLEQYYEKYNEGCEISVIVDDILKEAIRDRDILDNDYVEEMLRDICDYEQIKDKLIIKLVNQEKNQKYLEDKIYKEYLDLAVVFQIVVAGPDKNMATICVSNKMFEKWNISLEELYSVALDNSQRLLPANIMSIEDVIIGLIEEQGKKADDFGIEESLVNNATPLYVLSNTYKNKGATTILYRDILKDFAIRCDVNEVIIIPSSVDEVLLIPKISDNTISEENCKEMLLSVNDTLEMDIVLSSNIYVYNLIENEIRIYND